MTAIMSKPFSARPKPLFSKQAHVVIVGGGPAGLHFAHKMKEGGYKTPLILEAEDRVGGKSHTRVTDQYPSVRHEMGTCYMHLGYQPVRALFEKYGLADQEVELGKAYTEAAGKGSGATVRKVWDLKQTNDFERGDHKGQDFEDWILSAQDSVRSKMDEGASKTDTKKKYQEEVKNLTEEARALRQEFTAQQLKPIDTEEGTIKVDFDEEDLESLVQKAEEAAPMRARSLFGGDGEPTHDFEDAEGMELEGLRLAYAALRVFVASRRYIAFHRDLFGDYVYGLPPQPPTEELRAELTMPFREWLESKGLDALIPFFIYSQAAQGYGSMETVPALYGLWWNAPNYISPTMNPLEQIQLKKPAQAVMKCGFSALWENMKVKDGLNVVLHAKVDRIDRTGAKPVVHYTKTIVHKDHLGRVQSEEVVAETEEADYVLVTVPLKPAMNTFLTPTDEERAVLSKLQGLTLKTTLCRADPPSGHSYPGEVWLGPLNNFNGHVRYLSNSDLSVSGKNIETRPAYVVYQAWNGPPTDEVKPGVHVNEHLRNVFDADIEKVGLHNVEVLLEKPWDYFWHFPAEAIKEGAPWKLLELQGQKGIIFGGSSCCFESVLDVMAYNDLLFEMLRLE